MRRLAYRADVDGLRAVAVVPVLLFHVGFPAFQGGFVGVDVFFVISGFLITRLIKHEIERGTFTFTNFYVRRVRRLFPALLCTAALTFAAAALLFSPQHLSRLGGSLTAALFSVSNFYFWSESGYFDTDAIYKPLLHTWSLSVEEQFYLVWPATLLFLLSRPSRRAAPAFLVGAFAVSLGVTHWILAYSPEAAFFLAPSRVPELALGALLVWVEGRRPRYPLAGEALVVAGLALIAWSVATYSDDTLFPGLSSLVPCAGAALAIQFGQARLAGRLLSNPVCVYAGLISYSLYLVHWPLYVFYCYLTFQIPDTGERLGIVAASLLLAALMNRFVEMPFRRRVPDAARPQRRFAATVAVCAAALLAPAGHALASNGWTWRLDRPALSARSERSFHDRYFGGGDCQPLRCETSAGPFAAYALGDSHVQHYFDGFKAVFPHRRFVFYHAGSCDFWAPDIQVVRRGTVSGECTDAKAMAFRAIRAHPGPVVLSESWLRPMVQTLEDRDSGERMNFRKRSAGDVAAFIVERLRRLKAELGVPRVIVLGELPRFGPGSPYICANRLPWLDTPDSCLGRPRMQRSLTRARNFNAAMGAALEGLAGEGLHWLDPFAALCDESVCHNFEDGKPLYSDSGHLSVWGSRRVIERFKARLEQLLSS